MSVLMDQFSNVGFLVISTLVENIDKPAIIHIIRTDTKAFASAIEVVKQLADSPAVS